MNRLATLAMTMVSLLFVGVTLLAGDGISHAQQRSDSDNVNAAVNAFHAALSNLDIGKMQSVWAQEPYAVLVNPRDKAPAIGWDAVKKDWQDGVFGFWAELKLSPKQAPQIHINQGMASNHRRHGRRRQKQERSGSQLYHHRDAGLREARRPLANGFTPRLPGARLGATWWDTTIRCRATPRQESEAIGRRRRIDCGFN